MSPAVVGWTDGDGTVNALRDNREVVDSMIAAYRAHVFSTAGDSIVAELPYAIEAIRAEIAHHNEPFPKQFRISFNIGHMMAKTTNVFGDGVNIRRAPAGVGRVGRDLLRPQRLQARQKQGRVRVRAPRKAPRQEHPPAGRAVYRVLLVKSTARPQMLAWLAAIRHEIPAGCLGSSGELHDLLRRPFGSAGYEYDPCDFVGHQLAGTRWMRWAWHVV